MEAVGDIQNTPPPLPTLPRPRLPEQTMMRAMQNSGPTGYGYPGEGYNGTTRSRGSNNSGDSDASGSFRSHLTTARPQGRRNSAPLSQDGAVNNLRQLYTRQTDLALKSLEKEMGADDGKSSTSFSHYESDDDSDFPAPALSMSEFSFGPPTLGNNRHNKRRNYNQDTNERQYGRHETDYDGQQSNGNQRDYNDNNTKYGDPVPYYESDESDGEEDTLSSPPERIRPALPIEFRQDLNKSKFDDSTATARRKNNDGIPPPPKSPAAMAEMSQNAHRLEARRMSSPSSNGLSESTYRPEARRMSGPSYNDAPEFTYRTEARTQSHPKSPLRGPPTLSAAPKQLRKEVERRPPSPVEDLVSIFHAIYFSQKKNFSSALLLISGKMLKATVCFSVVYFLRTPIFYPWCTYC